MSMANQKLAELPKPGVGSLHDPALFVTTHLAAIFVAPSVVVLAIGANGSTEFAQSKHDSMSRAVPRLSFLRSGRVITARLAPAPHLSTPSAVFS